MINTLKKQNGMSIVGQGGKIILFMLPSLIAAIMVHLYLPQIAALPGRTGFIRLMGYLFQLPGQASVMHCFDKTTAPAGKSVLEVWYATHYSYWEDPARAR